MRLQQTNNIEARAAWMFDNLDLAGFANGLAARAVTGSTDDRRKNMYFYRDTLGTREWTFFPWDQDWTFGGPYSPVDVHPFYSDHAHAGGSNNEQWSYHYEALYNDPRTRQMIVRRMRTVMDQLLQPPGTANGWLERRADYWFAPAFPHLGTSVSNNVQSLKTQVPRTPHRALRHLCRHQRGLRHQRAHPAARSPRICSSASEPSSSTPPPETRMRNLFRS